MKKFSILGMCALISLGAMAQEAVVKEAERAMKGGKSLKEVVTIITPAFSDPATAQLAQTFFIPGKAAFNQYDNFLGQKGLGKLSESDAALMPQLLLDGYNYFMKALPLDSVPDAKGKVKPKYSKEMISILGGHHSDFVQAGIDLFTQQDYQGAYDAWDVYVTLPENPVMAKAITNCPADSTRSEIMYNQGLAAYNTGDMRKTVDAFMRAKNLGYHQPALYMYALAAAVQAKDKDAANAIAMEGMELFPDDPRYASTIVNNLIDDKEYNKALDLVNGLIAKDPNNSNYYLIQGVLFEQDGIEGSPRDAYQKAVDLDPYNKEAMYYLGRMLWLDAVNVYNELPGSGPEFIKGRNEVFMPLAKKAVDVLENAYNLDSDNKAILQVLNEAYYLMEDEKNLEYTNKRMSE